MKIKMGAWLKGPGISRKQSMKWHHGTDMRITEHGKLTTATPDFGEYVSSICRYSTPAELEGLCWYISAATCSDDMARLAISDYRELQDFVNDHGPEISACITGFEA